MCKVAQRPLPCLETLCSGNLTNRVVMPILKLNLPARAHHYTGLIRAMSSTNMSLRDEKKALRKFMKERLAQMTEEEVMDQCSDALFLMEFVGDTNVRASQ